MSRRMHPASTATVRIICLQKYRCGYRGFLEETEHWVMFQFSRRGGLRRLATYARIDFDDYAHFVGMMGRFISASAFLPAPLVLTGPDMEGLDGLWETRVKRPPRLTAYSGSDN